MTSARAKLMIGHVVASYIAAAVIIYHIFPIVQIPPGPAPLILKILVTAGLFLLSPFALAPFLIVATAACMTHPGYRKVWVGIYWLVYVSVFFITVEVRAAAYRRSRRELDADGSVELK